MGNSVLVPAPGASVQRAALVRKLGIGPGMSVTILHGPDDATALLGDLPDATIHRGLRSGRKTDMLIGFVAERAHLERNIDRLIGALGPTGCAVDRLAEALVRRALGHERRGDPRGRASDGLGRREGVRSRRHLVGAQVRVTKGVAAVDTVIDVSAVAVSRPPRLETPIARGRGGLGSCGWAERWLSGATATGDECSRDRHVLLIPG